MRDRVAFLSGSAMGLLLGILVGLSTSPVVGAVIGGLVTIMTGFFGLKDGDTTLGAQPSAVQQSTYERRLLLMGFGFASLLGTLMGLTIRTQSLLSPSLSSEVRRLTTAGFSSVEARSLVAQRFYSADGKATSASSVLFSATQEECDQANPAIFETSENILALYRDVSGRGGFKEAVTKRKVKRFHKQQGEKYRLQPVNSVHDATTCLPQDMRLGWHPPLHCMSSATGKAVTSDVLTPDVLTEQLGISQRTLRHLTDVYSEVYGALPRSRPRSGQRLFPLVAVERLIAAHQMMHDTPGMSALDALVKLRDRVTMPHPLESVPDPDILAQVRDLQAQVTTLQAEVTHLRTLVRDFVERRLVLPDAPLTQPAFTPAREVSTDSSAARRPPASLQPGLMRLLSNLEAGYILREIRGEAVLLTSSGQQVRLVEAHAVTSLIKQGWLVREGDCYRATFY